MLRCYARLLVTSRRYHLKCIGGSSILSAMPETTSLSQPSTATDFQPTTGNPQSNGAANLQVPATDLQSSNSGGLTAEQLYQKANNTANLKVEVAQGSTESRTAVPSSPAGANWTPVWWIAALVIVVVVLVGSVLALRRLLRPKQTSLPAPGETLSSGEPPTVAAAPGIPVKKSTSKKRSSKHASKRSRRKTSKKR